MRELASGQADDPPLPDRRTLRDMEKKLSGVQRLVRVWTCQPGDARAPIVFELADQSLWQLCDAGLGWTRFKTISPEWMEHPEVKSYLPADIQPRPRNAEPWQYEFNLADGAVLWVKPGREDYAFRWGVRSPKGHPRKDLDR